ncbi:group II truncated hemoglobin [Actinoplanes sp. NPDC051513]|uniref:group II truncated hemoglobin n=1 Tax=Actinoplanes sp. NPDC051513 TaxID=3363908 RepID=UPI00379FA7C8
MESLYEHVGKEGALRRTISVWYASVLRDPQLHPLFGEGRPTHVDHLTAFFAEVFGGPTRFTDELGGFPALADAHRGKRITEEQRRRFIELFLLAADETDLPDDEPFRHALAGYLEFGTEVAVVNSHATSEAELHPCQEVPRWSW